MHSLVQFDFAIPNEHLGDQKQQQQQQNNTDNNNDDEHEAAENGDTNAAAAAAAVGDDANTDKHEIDTHQRHNASVI